MKSLNFVKGVIIGIAKIIPGLSGAVLMMSFNLYDKALLAITNILHNRKINNDTTNIAPNIPSSSQITAKIMSFCASGIKLIFCMLLPSPLPKKPPEPMAYRDCTV